MKIDIFMVENKNMQASTNSSVEKTLFPSKSS